MISLSHPIPSTMKYPSIHIRRAAIFAAAAFSIISAQAADKSPVRARLVSARQLSETPDTASSTTASQAPQVEVRDIPYVSAYYAKWPIPVHAPLIFSGYRPQTPPAVADDYTLPSTRQLMRQTPPVAKSISHQEIAMLDSLSRMAPTMRDSIATTPRYAALLSSLDNAYIPSRNTPQFSAIPTWLTTAIRADIIQQNLKYDFMLSHPRMIDYAYWDLPIPPQLPDDNLSYDSYIRTLNLPTIDTHKAILAKLDVERTLWLHYLNTGMQFSQAFISSNWYQGGNDYVALLFNFNWNVDLNTVYYPKWLFQSSFSYKLGVNSNPTGSIQKYSVSQDQLQYNLKLGYKAVKRMFWSFNLRFVTPLVNTYPANSETRTAAFMSPGSLNIGLGMTYNYATKANRFKLSASVSPISYNLKTCFAKDIDHLQYKIPADRYTLSEIGSSVEANADWNITSNISWRNRIFLFTDYDYFQADWENTINFEINKFLSTQLYLRPRFDSSTVKNEKWGYWMFKEILSFGLSYTFNSKI